MPIKVQFSWDDQQIRTIILKQCDGSCGKCIHSIVHDRREECTSECPSHDGTCHTMAVVPLDTLQDALDELCALCESLDIDTVREATGKDKTCEGCKSAKPLRDILQDQKGDGRNDE